MGTSPKADPVPAGLQHGSGLGPTTCLSAFCSLLPEGHLNLTAPCNTACGCQPEHYSPVCGSDGLMYFSLCHAGCPAATEMNVDGQKVSEAAAYRPVLPWTLGRGPRAFPL